MSGQQVEVAINQIEKQRLGYQAISLTNFDNDSEPQVCAGSTIEIAGALFEFTSNESITGWGAIGNNNDVYIKCVVSGTSVTAEFTTAAPTWSESKQGWYVGLDRYIGGLYKDASGNYTKKRYLKTIETTSAGELLNPDCVKTSNIQDLAIATAKIANSAVSQAKLETSQGEVDASVSGSNVTLPGGEYGFYPRIKVSAGSGDVKIANSVSVTSYTTTIHLQPSGGNTIYAQQRYITSSGPIKWIFLLRNKKTKQFLACFMAEDHPCYGNGGDPELMPHPFIDFDEKTQEIIVMNPTDREWFEIKKACGPSKGMWESFSEIFKIDEKSQGNYPDEDITVGLEDGQVLKKRMTKPAMVTVKKIKK